MCTKFIDGDYFHDSTIKNIIPKLSYSNSVNYGVWKNSVRQKFLEILGDMPDKRCDLNINIEYRKQCDGYEEIRLVYESEPSCMVPVFLLIPTDIKKPCPVVICLQGHSSGMHISMGISKYPDDEYNFPRAAHGLNAVKHGYAALVIEQRGMGERRSSRTNNDFFTAYTALLLGRTIIGERCWDISRGIDVLASFPEIDTNKIICVGNSGGGTATYYASCFDERIKLTVPSCAVSSYKDSIGRVFHCPCNYIPGALKWFDMGELACMIAPRRLLMVNGERDTIFPIEGVKTVFNTIEAIYKQEAAADKCELMVTPMAHWFCYEEIWARIDEIMQGESL